MDSSTKTKVSLRDVPRMDESKMRIALQQLTPSSSDKSWDQVSREDLAASLVAAIKERGNKVEIEFPVEQTPSSSSSSGEGGTAMKRQHQDCDGTGTANGKGGGDDDDDDEAGPAIPDSVPVPQPKKRKKGEISSEILDTCTDENKGYISVLSAELAHEHVYLESLPKADMYEKSYMHRGPITHLEVSHQYDFLITVSCSIH